MTKRSIRIFNALEDSKSITETVKELCESGDFDWDAADKYAHEILGKYRECMESDEGKRENLFHLVVASTVMSHMIFYGLREEFDRTPYGDNLKLVTNNLPGMVYEQGGVLVCDMLESMVDIYLTERQSGMLSKKGVLN